MIEIKNLSYKYEDKYVLRDINLTINEGCYISILGHNGSGKTTLAKHLNSLLLPAKGDVVVDGINTKNGSWEIRQKVGIVFQNPDDQLINSIVEEDVAFGLENIGLPSKEIQKKVEAILKKLNITYLAKENVNNLSFGQKQLAALAGVLVMSPKYLVFDEPTSALDPKNRLNIMKIISQLNKEGTAIILVTQSLSDLKHIEKAVILKNGIVIFNNRKNKINKDILKKADIYAE